MIAWALSCFCILLSLKVSTLSKLVNGSRFGPAPMPTSNTSSGAAPLTAVESKAYLRAAMASSYACIGKIKPDVHMLLDGQSFSHHIVKALGRRTCIPFAIFQAKNLSYQPSLGLHSPAIAWRKAACK